MEEKKGKGGEEAEREEESWKEDEKGNQIEKERKQWVDDEKEEEDGE